MSNDAELLTELEQLALIVQLRRVISNDGDPPIEQLHFETELVSFVRQMAGMLNKAERGDEVR